MVFCRFCGKEIPETAHSCPYCNNPQIAGLVKKRNVVALIGLAVAYTVGMWLIMLFAGGMFAGLTNPADAEDAGAAMGRQFGGPFFLLALLTATILTVLGLLPGTRKTSGD